MPNFRQQNGCFQAFLSSSNLSFLKSTYCCIILEFWIKSLVSVFMVEILKVHMTWCHECFILMIANIFTFLLDGNWHFWNKKYHIWESQILKFLNHVTEYFPDFEDLKFLPYFMNYGFLLRHTYTKYNSEM